MNPIQTPRKERHSSDEQEKKKSASLVRGRTQQEETQRRSERARLFREQNRIRRIK